MTNALVLILDDARRDALDYMPWVSAMAKRGTTFTRGYVAVASCTPSRAAFYSGQYARSNGIYDNGGVGDAINAGTYIPAQTLGPWLQAAGVTTAHVGYYGVNRNSAVGWSYARNCAFIGGQEHWDYTVRDETGTNTAISQWHHEYFTDRLMDFTSSAAGQPWVAVYATNSPHLGFADGPGYPFEHNGTVEFAAPPQFGEGWPSWVEARDPIVDFTSTRVVKRGQARECADLDRYMRSLWDHLVSIGEADDTLLVVVSDNGAAHGEHRQTGSASKGTCYEESAGVPITITGPGFPMQHTCNLPVSTVDLTATLLAISGATATLPQDGVDLREVVAHPQVHADRAILVERKGDAEDPLGPDASAIATADHKFIRNDASGDDELELYDLANDPGELVNLASDPAYSAIVQDLDARLDSMIGAPASAPEFTGGDQVYDDDGYRHHVFHASGTLTMVSPGFVDYEVVSGGGGGGGAGSGQGGVGGGGGSGVPLVGSIKITESTAITVGAGGTGSANNAAPGGSGGDSSIGAAVVAPGGGGGGAANSAPSAGASGGGGGGPVNSTQTYDVGAAGSLGGNGGNGLPSSTAGNRLGGGGGGAGGDGGDGVGGDPGVGGAGVTSTVLGDLICGGGGGGGGTGSGGGASHGGGAGASSSTPVTAGTPNTGGGGGGGATSPNLNGGNGGSGRVVVRYPTP